MNRIKKLLLIADTVARLGIRNVLYIFYYRLSIKSGMRKKMFKESAIASGTFFKDIDGIRKDLEEYRPAIIQNANAILAGEFTYFHYHQFKLGEIPNWFYDPFSKEELDSEIRNRHWTQINEFGLNTGDVKNLWEISRFDWVTDLARAYSTTKENKYLTRLNELLNDWSENNPVNMTINWQCGQETSIRVMKLFNASVVLDSVEGITLALWKLIFQHVERINGNIQYAIAQDNNHGTSEAAGLYVGSLWLLNQGRDIDKEKRSILTQYKKKARRILEGRIKKLVLRDGTFAQKSVNYHRVVVDTMSFVLYAMLRYNEPVFTSGIQKKLENLGNWLLQMISSAEGDAPNFGPNDGAMLETLHSADYRDFRPSLQLYFSLVRSERVWNEPSVSEPLLWRKIEPTSLKRKENAGSVTKIFDSEFIQFVHENIVVRVKATQDNFRPGNDVLHLDIWYKGVNVLLDSGTYSYNSSLSDYFNSISAHNSVQFGEDEPMPKISRFLNGKWIKVKNEIGIVDNDSVVQWEGSYKDYKGREHRRHILLDKQEKELKIVDFFNSKKRDMSKTLRFHVVNEWKNYINISCIDGNSQPLAAQEMVADHSLYYMGKRSHRMCQFEQRGRKGEFRTVIKFIS